MEPEDPSPDDDPLLDLIALVTEHEGANDAARWHDDYLYGNHSGGDGNRAED